MPLIDIGSPEKLDRLPRDAVDFFCVFARFEFALKASGCFSKRKDGSAEADWEKYRKRPEIMSLFHSLKKSDKVKYIIKSPPKTQIVLTRDCSPLIDWEQKNDIPLRNMKGLIRAIKQTRNNLFHGGKTFAGEFIVGSERNHKLIAAATTALLTMLNVTEDVKEKFYSKDDV